MDISDHITLSGDSKLKIVTTGDNHLGKRQYKSDERKQDYMDSFKEVIDITIDRDFDAIVNKGDLFDDPQPDVETVKQTIEQIKKLDDKGIPFLAIVGNHERKQETQWIELIDRLSNVYKLSQEPTVIENDETAVVLYGIDAVRKYQWDKKDLSLKRPDGYSDANKIAVMHELISPPINEGIEDYRLQDVLQRLNCDIDVLGLSDYHRPVETEYNDTSVYYSGSTEKTKYNEPKHHSIAVLSVDETISKNRIQLESPRDFRIKELEITEESQFKDIVPELDEVAIGESHKPPVVIIKLEGNNTTIQSGRIIEYMNERGALLTRVMDNRVTQTIDIENKDLQEQSIEDIENTIDKEIHNLDLSDTALDINGIVRNLEIPDSNVRDKINMMIENKGDNK